MLAELFVLIQRGAVGGSLFVLVTKQIRPLFACSEGRLKGYSYAKIFAYEGSSDLSRAMQLCLCMFAYVRKKERTKERT